MPIFRSPHTPEYTARGVAIGVFWGLTPTVGLQTGAVLGTWYVAKRALRAPSSLLQAILWASVNNPLTMIPMYYGFYLTGLWMMGSAEAAPAYAAFVRVWDRPGIGLMQHVSETLRSVGLPMLLGCLPYASVGSFVSYRWALALARRRRDRLRRRRVAVQSSRPPLAHEL